MLAGPLITVITPTTGKPSLDKLIASTDAQVAQGRTYHLLLWDHVRHANARAPASYDGPARRSLVLHDGLGRNGNAPGSPLRAVGLMAANTPWVTFADDDVYWDDNHVAAILAAVQGRRWASTLRTIWRPSGARLGVDRFESVGDDPSRGVSSEMCDNNCMLFERPLGAQAAVLYRETMDYNDDRLMYSFLKGAAGQRGRTNMPTIHQVCPPRLVEFFRLGCSQE